MTGSEKFRMTAAAAFAAAMLMVSASCGGEPQVTETAATEATTPPETTTTAATTIAPIVTTTTSTTPPPLPIMEQYQELFDDHHGFQKDKDGNDTSEEAGMIGWIHIDIPGETAIDEPVMQTSDNKYYLTHDFENNEVVEGALFADYQCKFTTRTRPANTIIYGHNMASGKSFAKITRYCPWYTASQGLKQYNAAPTIKFDTLWEEGTYKVFAAIFVNTQVKNGEVFQYYKRRTIANEGQFYNYIGHVMDRSLFYTGVDLQYGDELLTLSTCYYPLGKENADTRFVVFARRLRPGESAEVDTSKAYVNPDPLYFDYWYQTHGTSWGGRKWDTSLVKGFDEYYKKHETTKPTED